MVPMRAVSRELGRAFDAVIFDGHAGLDADALGCAHGLVWGDGGFVLRLPVPSDAPPDGARVRLAAYPYGPSDVGTRFAAHVHRALARARLSAAVSLSPPLRTAVGHDEQARVVEALARTWCAPGRSRIAVLAARGRGKSSALGLALAAARDSRATERARVAVTAPSPEAVAEVFRFALGHPAAPFEGPIRFVAPPDLVFGPERFDLIVIDEAAQLPVPLLRRLVEVHAGAHLAFATTTHGYEGTGRGFSLRLLTWLERGPVPVQRLTLRQPIRWDPGDPLERFAFDALLLDAEPARLPEDIEHLERELVAQRLDRDALLADETCLRELFGLLVHAHYRTTPSDLHRLLDAPNLAVHGLRWRGHVVAATIVAREGGLPPKRCEAMASGAERIRAHALPDALVCHLGKTDAGALRMIRSVRIATHPLLRRRGLATRLVEHVHREHAPDLFGTLFGATAELLEFRRSLGYALVRISASRGARTGEPSAMMLRPVSERARTLVAELRAELARDLPRQLELLHADAQTLLDPALQAELTHDLPEPAPLPTELRRALVESYAHGPRTFESVALALASELRAYPQRLQQLPPASRGLLQDRVLHGLGWREVARRADMTVPAAMRALRRAARALLCEP